MHFTTTLAVISLLAASTPALGLTAHDNAARVRDLTHKRRAAQLSGNVKLRAESAAPAIRKIHRKRGSANAKCRAPGSTATFTPTGATTASATTTATTTPGSGGNAYVQQGTTTTTTNTAGPTGGSSSSNSTSGSGSPGSSGGGSSSNYTPNGKKAGMSMCTNMGIWQGHTSWCYDWTPNPSTDVSGVLAVPMLWGGGVLGSDQDDAARLAAFKALPDGSPFLIGFEEPDCSTAGSANMDVATAASIWDQVMGPHEGTSTLLGPSMCHQADETYLAPFNAAITSKYQINNLHINKNSMAGVQLDLDHYWNTYGLPMWVTEFACVDDQNGFTPCTDQGQINQFISDIVDLFENDSRVFAYAPSNGIGLGNVWPLYNSDGSLSASGQAYLAAISKYN